METPNLNKALQEQDWEETSRIVKENPEFVKEALSEDDFNVLWFAAPCETIQALLQTWPEAYKEPGCGMNLVAVKSVEKQWEFLDKIFREFPQVLERKYASTAAMNGASLEFLNKHWKETGLLLHSVYSKDWEQFGEVLIDNLQLVKDQLSEYEFDILWSDLPLETTWSLLETWPEAYEKRGSERRNLVAVKVFEKQWDFLKSILHGYPNIVTAKDVRNACYKDVPADVLKLMLEQKPNTPLEYPNITFYFIGKYKLEHFCAVLDRCPAETEVKQRNTHLTPLLLMFREKEQMNADWIGPILKVNPDVAKETDFDGKTALHLAYQHGASSDLINMIQQAYPKAENTRDNLGRFPKDLANQSEKTVFTPANETLILQNNSNIEKSYPDNAVVVWRGDMLMRDPQLAENEEDKITYWDYSQQVLARHRIFETLLDEFSKMVGVDDKDVIQKAAAIQALAAQYLSGNNDTIINFGTFENPGYWNQQEVLKLVTRVYNETRYELDYKYPSIKDDANSCMRHLERRKTGETPPKPSDEYNKAYDNLTKWLTDGFDDSSLYSLQGLAIKPLQSLFNKLFIRRGQTSVSVIGDLVRGTLSLESMAMLDEVVKRIKNAFPNITENQFRSPDKCTGLADFLSYVHDDLNLLPDSDGVLPYRFKANSSQKKKEKPLWYNLNFFFQIPEYHRVGFSEMFVACELQIGVKEEINKHRQTHVAYERDRILSNQPLLRNYDTMRKEEDENKLSRLSNCTSNDNKLIQKVLFGQIASEVLVPCTTADNVNHNDNSLLFENGSFSLSNDEIKAGSFEKPGQQCINNRCLNWFAFDCPKKGSRGGYICAAFVVAGPYELDETKRYFVDSLVIKNTYFRGVWGTIGLYAHVGPYLIQIACSAVGGTSSTSTMKDIVVVKSGHNFYYLEQMCPVPIGTTALEVIVYGEIYRAGELGYEGMNLSLNIFGVY